jgi:hypothetical protein
MINTHNLIDVFLSRVVFVLESIAETSLYVMSEIRRFISRPLFLIQLFKTWRTYNVTHASGGN